ncbi:hypothetical protein V6N13_116062 [Hibiscus sabdariffa]
MEETSKSDHPLFTCTTNDKIVSSVSKGEGEITSVDVVEEKEANKIAFSIEGDFSESSISMIVCITHETCVDQIEVPTKDVQPFKLEWLIDGEIIFLRPWKETSRILFDKIFIKCPDLFNGRSIVQIVKNMKQEQDASFQTKVKENLSINVPKFVNGFLSFQEVGKPPRGFQKDFSIYAKDLFLLGDEEHFSNDVCNLEMNHSQG